MITQEKPREIYHRQNPKEVVPSKKILLWRGIDNKTAKYLLTNRYIDDKLLTQNGLEWIVEQRKARVATAE